MHGKRTLIICIINCEETKRAAYQVSIRSRKKDNRKLQERCHAVTNMTSKSNIVCESEQSEHDASISCSDSDDGDFVMKEQSKKRNLDIMSPVSLCCYRLGLSSRKKGNVCSKLCEANGSECSGYKCVCILTALRKGHEERQKKFQSVRELFQAYPACPLHWDGKKIKVKLQQPCSTWSENDDHMCLKKFVQSLTV